MKADVLSNSERQPPALRHTWAVMARIQRRASHDRPPALQALVRATAPTRTLSEAAVTTSFELERRALNPGDRSR